MRSFIKLWGEEIELTSTHQDYADNVIKLPLKTVLENHARVHIHNKHFVLETNQSHLTRAQKIKVGKLYKEYGCIAYTVQINCGYWVSDVHECCNRIAWNKIN
jgi:hypothetical protein